MCGAVRAGDAGGRNGVDGAGQPAGNLRDRDDLAAADARDYRELTGQQHDRRDQGGDRAGGDRVRRVVYQHGELRAVRSGQYGHLWTFRMVWGDAGRGRDLLCVHRV